MQGESPSDAFTSLPASMRGADEGVDDVLTLDPLVPVAPVKGAPKDRLWSLDKEQVSFWGVVVKSNELETLHRYTHVHTYI